MSVEFLCPECGHELKADERSSGRRARCPDCGTLLIIPGPTADAGEPEDELVALEEVPDGSVDEVVPREEIMPPEEPPVVVTRTAPAPPPPPRTAETKAARPRQSDEQPLLAPARPHPEDLIDMTAMVDIVFFLLIFFLVTSLQALESVMKMPTPQAAEGGAAASRTVADLENDPNYVTVRIEEDDSIWVEDTQVFNDMDLALRLRTARREGDQARSMLVIGDADASHGTAVRVFDAGAGAGMNNISLLIQEGP
jgi:biopolymer transport protein ExbD